MALGKMALAGVGGLLAEQDGSGARDGGGSDGESCLGCVADIVFAVVRRGKRFRSVMEREGAVDVLYFSALASKVGEAVQRARRRSVSVRSRYEQV